MNPSDVIVAAIIAAFASWLGLVISKEAKISEFRQNWIDELRNDISLLLGKVTEYHASVLQMETSRPTAATINEIMARIRLRLNFKEPKHVILFDEIVEMRNLITGSGDQEAVGQKKAALANTAAEILKGEWERVKRGEFVYRWTFRVLVVLIAYLLIVHFTHRTFWFRHI